MQGAYLMIPAPHKDSIVSNKHSIRPKVVQNEMILHPILEVFLNSSVQPIQSHFNVGVRVFIKSSSHVFSHERLLSEM